MKKTLYTHIRENYIDEASYTVKDYQSVIYISPLKYSLVLCSPFDRKNHARRLML